MNKTLLIISGGIEAVPGIRRAKAMGLHVVVSDRDPHAPGFDFADDRLLASTYDVAATVAAARRYHQHMRPLDGVICMAADVPVTVAGVAAELGLPGLPLETAHLAADKLAMKRHFVEQGIAVPWFSAVASVNDLKKIVAERGVDLVIKPVDACGARGVLRLSDDMDLEWAFNHARDNSATGRVMVEAYLHGPQISTESVMVDGVAHTAGFIDRNYEHLQRFAPFMIENGGQQPTALTDDQRNAVTALAERAGLAMGIRNGIAKGDMVLTGEGPKVIEIAARLSGGWMSSDQIPLATGVDMVGAAIQLALGEAPDRQMLSPKFHKGVAIRYFFPCPGRIVAIKNIDTAQRRPWVHTLRMFVRPGDVLDAVTHHARRAGFVITIGEDRRQAMARACEIVDSVVIETEPMVTP